MTTQIKISKRRMRAQLETIIAIVERFNETQLLELERISKISSVVDGWPSGGQGGGGSGVSNPTLMAVVKRITHRPPNDLRQVSAEAVAQAIEEAWQAITRAQRSMMVFSKPVEEKAGREDSLSECLCCSEMVVGHEGDRLRSGYCPRCYAAWRRSKASGDGDRMRFEMNRRKKLEASQKTEVAS